MSLPHRIRAGSFLLTGVLAFAAFFVSGCDSDSGATGLEANVTVMTRNLYLGAELFQLLDPSCETQITVCVAELYADVVNSDIPARMDAIAAEIEASNPDLVGLQEVSLYRTQSPSDFDPENPVPNAQVVSDLLGRQVREIDVAL